MKLAKPILHFLLIGLLLLQLPMDGSVFTEPAPMPNESGMIMEMGGSMGHPCHSDAGEATACEDRGCVFCGLANFIAPSSIQTYLAHLLFLMDDATPATPRFEQPVELRPPKHSPYA
jgi:hypothetical protein